MIIKEYRNSKEAIEDETKKDKEYVFIRHFLGTGREIKTHHHKEANEIIIIDNGKFKVSLEEETKIITLKKQAISIRFPQKKKHSLLALSPISYFVIRDN